MSGATLRELIEDLQVERRKLATLVASLVALRNQWQREGSTDERVDAAGLAEVMRFRHVLRHLYAYELDASQVRRLLEGVPELWRLAERDLQSFEAWRAELAAAPPPAGH
jgi:hypothetical protein